MDRLSHAELRNLMIDNRNFIKDFLPSYKETLVFKEAKKLCEKTGKDYTTTTELSEALPEDSLIVISTMARKLFDKGYLLRKPGAGNEFQYTPFNLRQGGN